MFRIDARANQAIHCGALSRLSALAAAHSTPQLSAWSMCRPGTAPVAGRGGNHLVGQLAGIVYPLDVSCEPETSPRATLTEFLTQRAVARDDQQISHKLSQITARAEARLCLGPAVPPGSGCCRRDGRARCAGTRGSGTGRSEESMFTQGRN